jgi:hypothetical protein
MRNFFILAVVALIFLPAHNLRAEPRLDIGASIVDGSLRGFHVALGEYFRVPEREIVVIRERRRMPEYDIPVALFIAQRAHVAPNVVVDMRLSGRSWMDISLHYGIGPDVYYVPVERDYGPPYGKAYGHYKKKHRKEWRDIRLDDDDFVNMVNLRFISEHYGYSPDEVVRMRSSGKNFSEINDEARRGTHRDEYRKDDRGKERDYQEQGRQNDKGKGRGNSKGKSEGKQGKGKEKD